MSDIEATAYSLLARQIRELVKHLRRDVGDEETLRLLGFDQEAESQQQEPPQ